MHPKLRETYRDFLKDASVKLSPYSPHLKIDILCESLGVKVVRMYDYSYKKASLIKINNTYEIRISHIARKNNEYTPFERFLIAHELGHLLIERRFATFPLDNSEYWEYENLCDYFARVLLLPERYIQDKMKETNGNLKTLLDKTNFITYDALVPWPAVAYRITDFNSKCALFRVRCDSSHSDNTHFKIDMSTLQGKKEIGRKFSTENALGSLFAKMKNKDYLDLKQILSADSNVSNKTTCSVPQRDIGLDKTVSVYSSIAERFPSLSKFLQGVAYRVNRREIRFVVEFFD